MKRVICLIVMTMILVVPSYADMMSVSLPDAQIRLTGDPDDPISVSDYGILNIPGNPQIPSRIFLIAVPPDADISHVSVTSGQSDTLDGQFNVQPVSMKRAIGNERSDLYEAQLRQYRKNIESMRERTDAYPDTIGEFLGVQYFRNYRLAAVRVNPLQFIPAEGRLIRHSDIRVDIDFDRIESNEPVLLDVSARMEARARNFIINYHEAQAWYANAQEFSRGLNDFVIITTQALTSAVAPLVQHQENKGRTVEVVTVEWIGSNYTGSDLAQKMRNFLREKFPSAQWGIEDLLLVGTHQDVPMRMIAQDVGYGTPRTDFYFAELSQPDNQSWDSNSNGQYGEDADSVDYVSEIYVGRIPWSDSATVTSICEKSAAYEMNSDPAFKQNILLLGGYFWDDTDNAVLMEAVAGQSWMSNWTKTRLYEQNADYYSSYPCDFPLLQSNVVAQWSAGMYSFVNWAGHGSPTSSHILGLGSPAFIDSGDCSALNDSYPGIIFADACSNSDTDDLNIGKAMLKRGSVGFVGATKVAYGSGAWNDPSDGSSQSLDYFFTNGVTSGDKTQGESLQDALLEVYQMGGFYYPTYEVCEFNLWGNPDLGMLNRRNGLVTFNRNAYRTDQQPIVNVLDSDLNVSASVPDTTTVTITTLAGDSETFTLTESGPSTSFFNGTFTMSTAAAVPGNNTVEVTAADRLTVTYIDADNGAGGINIPKTDDALIDMVNPVISGVNSSMVTESQFTVTWFTDEPATTKVVFGDGTPATTVEDNSLVETHQIEIPGLNPCTYYRFYVESRDEAGNIAMDNNSGQFYMQATHELTVILDEPMDNDPEWTISGGAWAYGRPMGLGGEHGEPDPTNGYTGLNVYGYNLNGDYTNNMSANSLTTTAIDCSAATGTRLRFWRWLGVESSTYDHAYLKISSDGTNWATVWQNPASEIADSSWTLQEFDIASYADGQSTVYIRWTMGTTDGGWIYCGWNIDDVQVFCSQPCNGPTPTPIPPTPTPTSPPTPTPTQPQDPGLILTMNDVDLIAGDTFNLDMHLVNFTGSTFTADIWILLAVGSSYWCFPSWCSIDDQFDYLESVIVPHGTHSQQTVLTFEWPSNVGTASGLYFYGASFNAGTFDLIGNIQAIPWQFR